MDYSKENDILCVRKEMEYLWIRSKYYTNWNPLQSQKKKNKKDKNSKKGRDRNSSIGSHTRKGLPRKTGPSDEKKSSKKSGWKPPSWTKEVLDDDSGFLDYRPAHRGTTGKAQYKKAGYLPHAKWRKKKYKPEEYAGI